MRDDLLEKKDVPANVERLSQLIQHLKEQEKSYLRFLQKMLVGFSSTSGFLLFVSSLCAVCIAELLFSFVCPAIVFC